MLFPFHRRGARSRAFTSAWGHGRRYRLSRGSGLARSRSASLRAAKHPRAEPTHPAAQDVRFWYILPLEKRQPLYLDTPFIDLDFRQNQRGLGVSPHTRTQRQGQEHLVFKVSSKTSSPLTRAVLSSRVSGLAVKRAHGRNRRRGECFTATPARCSPRLAATQGTHGGKPHSTSQSWALRSGQWKPGWPSYQ